MEGGTAGTHQLESGGHSVSAGTKRREGQQALTSWRAEDTVCEQAQNGGRDSRHSRAREHRMWCVSRRKTEGGTAGTHGLESGGHSVSAGTKQREGWQALTNWRVEDAVCQQAQNGGRDSRHSRTGERRTQCVSRRKTEGGMAGTHELETGGCSVSAGCNYN